MRFQVFKLLFVGLVIVIMGKRVVGVVWWVEIDVFDVVGEF